MSSIFIVVPAYNEGQVLLFTLQPVIKAGYTVVVVDDGSKDDSWSILASLPVYRLRHLINLGQGAALQTGTNFALQQGAEIIVHFDADGQHQATDIETMIEPLFQEDVDVVLGSRFLRKKDHQVIPILRRWLLRCAIVVNGILMGMWLSDAHNGFRAFSRKAAQQIQLRENRFAHASEILSQIRQMGLRYVERPTTIVYSKYSISKGQSGWNAINIIIDILLWEMFR